MKLNSYKNWKLVQESVFPGMTLGISHPQTLGLHSNLPGVSLSEKKKMHGDVLRDDEPEDDVVDDVEDGESEEDGGDDCSCKNKKVAFSKKKMKKCSKKNMKKKMHGGMDLSDDEVDDEADDVNDIETPDDDGADEGDWEDEESHDDEEDGEEGGDDWEDSEEDGDGEEEDEGGDEAPKFGFMKDKKKDWGKNKKKGWDKKKEKKVEEQFWADLSTYNVPKSESGTDEEFFDSLARQYGNPKARFHGGVDRVDEDLLLTPDQQSLIDAMPKPGEVGFGPEQRLGGGFAPSEVPDMDYMPYGENTEYEEAVEESADFEVLCKYLSEDVARGLIERRRNS
jgi:hypothetical protein